MMKRKLSNDEERFTKKNVELLKEELEYEEYLLQNNQFAIDSAPIVVKQQLKELNKKNKIHTIKVNEIKAIIEVSEKQIKEGVEIKEIKEVKK